MVGKGLKKRKEKEKKRKRKSVMHMLCVQTISHHLKYTKHFSNKRNTSHQITHYNAYIIQVSVILLVGKYKS